MCKDRWVFNVFCFICDSKSLNLIGIILCEVNFCYYFKNVIMWFNVWINIGCNEVEYIDGCCCFIFFS